MRHSIFGSVLLPIALTACSNEIPADGFKELKYGMNLSDLKELGFICGSDEIVCSRSSEHKDDDLDRFLGKKSRVSVSTSGSQLSAISIATQMTQDEVIQMLTAEFGTPKSFDYEAYGGMATKVFWLSGDATSLELTVSKDGSRGGQAYVSYNGPEATKELTSLWNDNKIDKNDT